MDFSNIRVCAFVGPSGTGKSYRAQMVAGENNIEFIIDDGLLIKGNAVVAGTSAKKSSNKGWNSKACVVLSRRWKKRNARSIYKI